MYPHSEAKSSDNIRRGYWHHLNQYCGIRFSRKDGTEGITNVDDGLFIWDEYSLKRIEKLQLSGCSNVREKQLVMVGYALELVYDLMIAVSDNVSQSPGFESCLGIFGG